MSKSVRLPVYNMVEIASQVHAVSKHPLVQRLHRLRQLGFTSIVYPGATHTRFEHSVGVAYLTDTLVRSLSTIHGMTNVGSMSVDEVRIALSVAGLLHDTGHGPFSHAWERVTHASWEAAHDGKAREDFDPPLSHEQLSVACVDRIQRDLPGLLTRDQWDLVRFAISGVAIPDMPPWVTEIVHNEVTGIDTDRIDYLKRDAYHTGMNIQCDAMRLIRNFRICQKSGHLALRAREADVLLMIGMKRMMMHKIVYQHPTVVTADTMLIHLLRHSVSFKHALDLYVKGDPDDILDVLPMLDDSIMYPLRWDMAEPEKVHDFARRIADADLWPSRRAPLDTELVKGEVRVPRKLHCGNGKEDTLDSMLFCDAHGNPVIGTQVDRMLFMNDYQKEDCVIITAGSDDMLE